MATVLVDTNLLVYAHDRGEHVKQAQAIEVLNHLQLAGIGRISAQSLGEFFSAVTKGKTPMLSIEEAVEQMNFLASTWPILSITRLVVLEAARGVRQHQLAYWDAQLWATARLNQIPVIFSEDFNAGAVLDGVRFVNPFAAEFVVEEWV